MKGRSESSNHRHELDVELFLPPFTSLPQRVPVGPFGPKTSPEAGMKHMSTSPLLYLTLHRASLTTLPGSRPSWPSLTCVVRRTVRACSIADWSTLHIFFPSALLTTFRAIEKNSMRYRMFFFFSFLMNLVHILSRFRTNNVHLRWAVWPRWKPPEHSTNNSRSPLTFKA